MGFIGFVDDYLKVIKSYNKGLIARYKLIGQCVCGCLLGYYLISNNYFAYIISNGEKISIPNTAISIPFILVFLPVPLSTAPFNIETI